MAITNTTEELLRGTAHKAADSVADAAEPISKWIDQSKDHLSEIRIAEYVAAHPFRCLTGGLLLGILIGKAL